MKDFDDLYARLKRLAHVELARHSPMTMNTTGLVHEAYVKLTEYGATVQDRQHLVNLVVRTMRQILIDEARKHDSLKRGGEFIRTDLSDNEPESLPDYDPIAITKAVDQIKAAHPRMGQVVEMHFFAGIEFGDIAELLDVDRRTIHRDWVAAKAILATELAA